MDEMDRAQICLTNMMHTSATNVIQKATRGINASKTHFFTGFAMT
jgi:hypothetical protein